MTVIDLVRNAGRAAIGLGLSCCLLAVACSSPSAPTNRIPVVQLMQDSAIIAVGDTLQAVLLPMLPPGYVPPVDWSSSDPTVAGVSATGSTSARIDGLKAGTAVIRAAGEGAKDSLVVTVTSGVTGLPDASRTRLSTSAQILDEGPHLSPLVGR